MQRATPIIVDVLGERHVFVELLDANGAPKAEDMPREVAATVADDGKVEFWLAGYTPEAV